MLLNPKKERAIVEWMNCLPFGDTIESLEELMDGKLFLCVINLMEMHTFPLPDDVYERFRIVTKFLDDYYQTSTKSLICYNACFKGKKFELAKVAVLLLSALVLANVNPSSQHLIVPLTNLDESVQIEIYECLKAVLLNQDGMKLNAEFVTVLSHQTDCTEEENSNLAPVYENSTPILQNPFKRFHLRNRLPFTAASPVSPLREFFDSPQLAAKAAVKEVASLRSRLLSEQKRTGELETELRKLHDDMDNKAKEEQELRKIITELRQYHDDVSAVEDYQILAEQQTVEIEKLLSRVKELEVYKNVNSYLEENNRDLLKENEKLEQNAKQIDNLHKINNEVSQENKSLIEQLNKIQLLNIDYENQLSCLQQDLQSTRKEVEHWQQVYKEKTDMTKISNSSTSSESCDSGECLLTAFTEIELSEVKCHLSQLQKEMEEIKEENKCVMLKNTELGNTVNSLNQSIERTTMEKLQLEEKLTNKLHILEEEKESLSKVVGNIETINNQLKMDCQKVKEENSNLQSLIDCLEKTAEKLYQEINHLSNKNNDVQKSYSLCSEQLESLRVQLNEAVVIGNNWKEKSLHLEDKYNSAIKSHNEREANLCLELHNIETNLKVLAAEKASAVLAADAAKLAMEKSISEKEKNMKEKEEEFSTLILKLNKEKECVCEELLQDKQMLHQLENQKQVVEKELKQKIDHLHFEKENLSSSLKEIQSCYNKKVNEIEEKSLIIASISCEKETLKASISDLEEIKKSHNNTIEELSVITKNLKQKLTEETSKLKIADQTLQAEVSRYEEKLLTLETKQAHLKQEKKELTIQLQELDNRFQNLEKSVEETMREKELNQTNFCSLQTDFEKLTLKLNQVEKEKHSLKEEMENLHKEYKNRLQEFCVNEQNLKSMITELCSELESKKQEIICNNKLLQEERQKYNTEICSLTQSLKLAQSDAVKTNMALENATAEHEKEVSCLNELVNNSEKIIFEIKHELGIKELQIKKSETLKNKMELLETDHQKLIEKLEDIERKLRCCKEAKEMAEKEYYMCVEQKEKDKEDLRRQLDLLQKEKEMQNQSYEEKLDGLNTYVETIIKTNEEMADNLRNEIDLLKTENSNLLSECRNLRPNVEECHMFKAEVERLNVQVKQLKEAIEEKELLLNEKENAAEAETKLLKNDVLEKCQLLSEKDETIASFSAEMDHMKEEICIIKQHKEDLTDGLAKKEKECSMLIRDIQEANICKQSLESEVFKLNEELSSSKQTNLDLDKQLENLENSFVNKDNCMKKLSAENECLQNEIKQLNQIVEQLKIDAKNFKNDKEEDETAGLNKVYSNDSSEHNKSTQVGNTAENLSLPNFDCLGSSFINVDDILERVECMMQSINAANKTDLVILINELRDKLNIIQPVHTELNYNLSTIQHKKEGNKEHAKTCTTEFLQKSQFGGEERELLLHKISDLSNELQVLSSELVMKNEKLNSIKTTNANKIHEVTEKSLNMEAAWERKQKKLIRENLQLEEKLQKLEIKNEKLNLEKQVLQKELNIKNQEIEDTLNKISQEQANMKKLNDMHQEEIQKLKNNERARRNEYFLDFRKEITQLQSQVKESEQKNEEIQHKLRQERDILFKKYEMAKKLITSLQGEKKETNEKLNEERGRYHERRTQLSSAQTELEKKALEVKLLLQELQDEQKRLVSLEDKIRKQEALLEHERKQKAGLKAQLGLAERQIISELKQQSQAADVFEQNVFNKPFSEYSLHDLERKPKHSRITAGDKERTVGDETNRKSLRMSSAFYLTQIELSARGSFDENEPNPNLSTSTRSDFMQNSIISTPGSSIHRPVPAGTGCQFTCEDEDGEFMNHSYLGDLKAGRCVVDSTQLKRISELQRRNTLCLPHLQSSYPVETQMHAVTDYTDDALKAGIALNDSTVRESDSNSKIPIKSKRQMRSPSPRKRKHLRTSNKEIKTGVTQHSSFQKPSLSTLAKKNCATSKSSSPRNRTCVQNENIPPTTPDISRRSIFKTPSSLQKFFRRRPLHTSKEANNHNERPSSRRINM